MLCLLASSLWSNPTEQTLSIRLVRGHRKHQGDVLSKDESVVKPKIERCRESDRVLQHPECLSAIPSRYKLNAIAVSLIRAKSQEL